MRRECLDDVTIGNARGLRCVLRATMAPALALWPATAMPPHRALRTTSGVTGWPSPASWKPAGTSWRASSLETRAIPMLSTQSRNSTTTSAEGEAISLVAGPERPRPARKTASASRGPERTGAPVRGRHQDTGFPATGELGGRGCGGRLSFCVVEVTIWVHRVHQARDTRRARISRSPATARVLPDRDAQKRYGRAALARVTMTDEDWAIAL